MAIAALVFGIISIIFAFPILGFVIAIVAIILGAKALGRVKRGVGGGRGMALGGVITGIIGAILNVLITVFFGAVIWAVAQSGSWDAIMECSQVPEAQRQACIDQRSQEIVQQQENPT
ncbi:DUF4190 domain-containing protein [Mobilicoccus caccae]|uniref:DUF4190 domain-containing protein n=1 Tax=Mobilicoccus caccae TaxID=1859295 RepID=A0ABQ6IQ25_9MICO|nr:DUF4190 domain-containing protein [Mobilicoccus caccae]GMA39435.1 hypothetical protein GCM10025883_14800 [Mobilicoccus caccae]